MRRPLTLVSVTQLHWLPCKNQFYPTSQTQLGPPPICNIGFLTFHHLDLRPEAFSYFLPRISNNICDFTAGSNSEKAVRAFSNELHQQLNEMRCQMWRVGAGGGQPSRQQVHICLKAFIFMFFIAEGASDIASLIRDSPG